MPVSPSSGDDTCRPVNLLRSTRQSVAASAELFDGSAMGADGTL
jgi:hypothetical protein